MNKLEKIKEELLKKKYSWLITGVAGFIGSNLLKFLLESNQKVIGLDNLSTGKIKNIEEVLALKSCSSNIKNFKFIESDITSLENCIKAVSGVDFVLHQAALGSVPRSIEEPIATYYSNDLGFINLLIAMKEKKISRLVYASSSSVYGNHEKLPKVENEIDKPLSPYAVTKLSNELFANVFFENYGLEAVGLRYFNVFGERQDPEGQYAAVIPRWIKNFIKGKEVHINGDGKTSRDFCYIENVVQANVLAALTSNKNTYGEIFNIACNERTSLIELFNLLKEKLSKVNPLIVSSEPAYKDFLPGDIRHSHANIDKAKELLGYHPEFLVSEGLDKSLDWYINDLL